MTADQAPLVAAPEDAGRIFEGMPSDHAHGGLGRAGQPTHFVMVGQGPNLHTIGRRAGGKPCSHDLHRHPYRRPGTGPGADRRRDGHLRGWGGGRDDLAARATYTTLWMAWATRWRVCPMVSISMPKRRVFIAFYPLIPTSSVRV